MKQAYEPIIEVIYEIVEIMDNLEKTGKCDRPYLLIFTTPFGIFGLPLLSISTMS